MRALIAIIQTILHYLGIIGIVLGVVAYILGNSSRGGELLIGGISFIVIKYLIGFAYLLLLKIISKKLDKK
jgi:hydrogenase-4 membrane subunit HyfE